MRGSIPVLATFVLGLAACAKPVPLTTAIREEMGPEAGNVAGLALSVLETFELRASGRATIVVRNYTKAQAATAPNDTTIVLDVLGAQVTGEYDALKLTFVRSRSADGAYTLRQINGAWLDGQIPIAGITYQYHPCYQNVGSKCEQPVATGTREDRMVRVGITR